MASKSLESGPFYRDEMSNLLNKSGHSETIDDHKADLLSGHVTSCPYGSHEDLTPWEYLAKH